MKFMKTVEFDLKWVHMARCELILRLDGALWLTIISKPIKMVHKNPKITPKSQNWLGHAGIIRHDGFPQIRAKSQIPT